MEAYKMDGDSEFPPIECGRRVDDGVDRISQLPDEILVVILSFLRFKEAAATSVLSSRWSDLWRHIPHIKFDRISQLPDEILLVILSFLSLREAAATSVLSSRWLDVWKHTPNLYFNRHMIRNCVGLERKCTEIVNSVIQSHKSLSLKIICLDFPFASIAKCTVTKWLEFVFSRQVESLELLFREHNGFVLEELLRESRIRLQPQTDLIFFQSLKRLFLRGLKVSGEDIKLFLRNCPLLEHLMIRGGTLTSDVEVCGANLMLKHLDILCIRCNDRKSIKVSAPSLTYVRFIPFNERDVKLLLENVPKLVEAYFNMETSNMVVQRFASSASCHFSLLQILELFLSESKMLFQLQVILANGFQMPNLKKLVISCVKTCNHSPLPITTALIWAFPRLEEFKLTHYGTREEQPPQVIMNGGRSPHQHLKVFELQMCSEQNVNDHKIAELVMYISNNCVALRKIIIDRRNAAVDPATRYFITQRVQGKVPESVQLELFNSSL